MPCSPSSSSPDQRTMILLVRLGPGVAGEADRVVHVVPLPRGGSIPRVLTAYCGEEIHAAAAEMLPHVSGMPCIACLLETPLYETMELPAGG